MNIKHEQRSSTGPVRRSYRHVLRSHTRLSVLHDDHGPANAPTITGNKHGPVVVVDVHADELAEPSRPPQPSEVAHEARGVPRQAYDSTVDVDNKGMGTVDLGPRR